jgi:hypothetical protein
MSWPWGRRRLALSLVTSLALAVVMVPQSGAQASTASTTTRPIADFVKAQGTFCISDGVGGCVVFVPPVGNFPAFTDPFSNRAVSVDYAGLADRAIRQVTHGAISFGTTTSGTITERPLADGTAKVDVLLRTTNALTWVIGCAPLLVCDFAGGPLLFGHRVPEIAQGADAALGSTLLHVRFINTAPGAPLPDLVQFFVAPLPTQRLELLSITGQASGTLRGAFGVPDGTPGSASIAQSGLLFNSAPALTTSCFGDGPAHLSLMCGFPVQHINLLATGQ